MNKLALSLRSVVVLAAVLACLSCGGDDPTEPEPEGLRSWWKQEGSGDCLEYLNLTEVGWFRWNEYCASDEEVNCIIPLGRWESVDNRLLLEQGAGAPVVTYYFRIESFGSLGPDKLSIYEDESQPNAVYRSFVRNDNAPAALADACH